jgi:D-3-phosphoglycerate dehydrogenase
LDKAGRELGSSTVGIVGFGAIGSRVAQMLSCFGARILVHDPFAPREMISDLGYESVPLDQLLSQSDVVSLHARVSPETRGMIGARELGLMKPTAVLVNTARADLIVPEALYQALESQQISGAALDVFEVEPLPVDHPLHRLENVTITSHLGGASVQAAEKGAVIAAEELRNFVLEQGQPRYCANMSLFETEHGE